MRIPVSANIVAQALDLTIGSDGQMTGLCPCHDDTRSSLSVKIDPTTGNLLTYCHAGCDQVEVYHTVVGKIKQYMAEQHIEIDSSQAEISASMPVTNKQDNIQFAQDIWHNADFDADIVKKYLEGRGLSGDLPASIRQANLEYTPGSGELHPCMIAEITDVNGNFCGIHRSFLTENADDTATKADVANPKKILGNLKECHTRLSDDYRDTLHLTEGIETGLAVQDSLSVSVWACLSAQNLATVIIPDDVENVFIWADKDLSQTGEKFAKVAAERLIKQGKKVYILTPDEEIPEGNKSIDWLDMGKEAILAAFSKATSQEASSSTPGIPWGHLQMPQDYRMDYNGVYREKINPKGEVTDVLVATGPLWLSGRRIDLASGETEIQISWIDPERKKHIRWLSRGHAFRSTTILEMAELSSFPVFDGINREAVRYLALFEKNNTIETELIARRPGWNDSTDNTPVYVLDGGTNLRVHPESAYRTYMEALKEKGSFSAWLEVVRPFVINFPIVLFALVAVLTPPLLRILRVQNFVVDFWGKTSCGKTTLLSLIASVWGKPTGNASLILSWNNTAIFTERIAAFFGQGLPLFLDDSQTALEKTIEAITYMVANGIARGRAKPYSVKDVDRFEVVMLTTGEKPLTEKSFPGAKARTIGIHGSPFPEVNPTALTTLKSVIAQNHGHLARRFVDALVEIPAQDLIAYHEQWLDHFTTMAKNEIGNRYASYFSAIRVAAHVLMRIPEMGWIREHLLTALFEVWEVATADVSETDMAGQALQGIAGWIESNKRHFAVLGCQTELQPTFGAIRRDENYVAILPHIFRQALRDIGIQSEAAALAEWKKLGYLLHHPARNHKQVKVEGKPVWCVCIKSDALFPNNEDGAAILPAQVGESEGQHPLPN